MTTVKAIITRNFKETNPSKYCVARYGKAAQTALECESVEAKDVSFVDTFSDKKLHGFANFGCGKLAVGYVDAALFENKATAPAERGANRLRWNGFNFEDDKGRMIHGASRVLFGPKGITATGLNEEAQHED